MYKNSSGALKSHIGFATAAQRKNLKSLPDSNIQYVNDGPLLVNLKNPRAKLMAFFNADNATGRAS